MFQPGNMKPKTQLSILNGSHWLTDSELKSSPKHIISSFDHMSLGLITAKWKTKTYLKSFWIPA